MGHRRSFLRSANISREAEVRLKMEQQFTPRAGRFCNKDWTTNPDGKYVALMLYSPRGSKSVVVSRKDAKVLLNDLKRLLEGSE